MQRAGNSIVTAVSGASIPALVWREHLELVNSHDDWPEEALLALVNHVPGRGRWNWFWKGGGIWAHRAWRAHIHSWWSRIGGAAVFPRLRPPNPTFLIETLEFRTGDLYVYQGDGLWRASAGLLKQIGGISSIGISPPDAVSAATAFPGYFRATRLRDKRLMLVDAGLVDNLGLFPLARQLQQSGGAKVTAWLMVDAGKKLSESLMPCDRVGRLTGDLAQPIAVEAVSRMMDLAGIHAMGIRPDAVSDLWYPNGRLNSGDAVASLPTTLARIDRATAIAVMAHGATVTLSILRERASWPVALRLSDEELPEVERRVRDLYARLLSRGRAERGTISAMRPRRAFQTFR
jgi:hypothetical protein